MKSTISLLVIALICTQINLSYAGESTQVKIDRAMSAAPTAISNHALILDADGSVLRQGSNGWTCLPDTLPNDKNPICNDATWMKALQALGSKSAFTPDRIGISYMLKGDLGAGVSNSDPYHNSHKDAKDYVETGPHLMIIVPKALLKDLPTDPAQGGPYVMWADTPYAHIMLPIDNTRPVMNGHNH